MQAQAERLPKTHRHYAGEEHTADPSEAYEGIREINLGGGDLAVGLADGNRGECRAKAERMLQADCEAIEHELDMSG